MMIKPGISELSRRVDSRYTLVTMASKRARMLGGKGTDDPNQVSKPVSEAVKEIAEGKVGYVRRTPIEELNLTGPGFYTENLSEELLKPYVPDEAEKSEPDTEIFMHESVNMPAYEKNHSENKKNLGE